MFLINETQFDAKLLRTILTDNVMIATVVSKVAYALTESGRLEPLPRQPAVLVGPDVIDGVAFPPDAGYGKQGVDVLVVGSAHTPGGLPHRVLMAGVTLGEVSLSVAVIGDRRWQKRWPGWVASDPQPFIDMPLTWANAFGGRARVRGAEIPHALNPEGKGYVLDTREAEGVALPNVENGAELIRDISDRPRPVSFCPMPLGADLFDDAFDSNEDEAPRLTTAIYNSAIAAHRLPSYPADQILRLHNLIPGSQAYTCLMPSMSLVAEVTVGKARHEFPAIVDTILVLADRRQLVITHRVVFRYDYARGRARTIGLRAVERRHIGAMAEARL